MILEFRRTLRLRREGRFGKRERRRVQRVFRSDENHRTGRHRPRFFLEFLSHVGKLRVRGFLKSRGPEKFVHGNAALDRRLDPEFPPPLRGYEQLPTMGPPSRDSGNVIAPLAYRLTPLTRAVLSLVGTPDKVIHVFSRRLATCRHDVRRKEAHGIRGRRENRFERTRVMTVVQHSRSPPVRRRRGAGIALRRKDRRTSGIFEGARRIGGRQSLPFFQVAVRIFAAWKENPNAA